MKISSILATKGMSVMTIRPFQTLQEAVKLFVTNNIGALVVVDEMGSPIGIISERDIMHQIYLAAEGYNFLSLPVYQGMNRNLITAVPQDDIDAVADTLTEERIRHLPVMDQGKLVGIVSIGDVLKAQRDGYKGEVDTLVIQMVESDTYHNNDPTIE